MKKYYILNHDTLKIETMQMMDKEHVFIDNVITFATFAAANKMRDYMDTDIQIND